MKSLIKTVGFIAGIAIFLLLAACNNPFLPDAPGNGEAYVTIRMGNGDNARTLYPTFAFDKYELQFTPEEGQTPISPVTITSGSSVTVTLAYGSWTVTAIGYVAINGADEEAARGTGALNVQAGSNSLNIELQPQKEEGTGTLSYNIVYPAVSAASLKIMPLLGDTPVEEKDLNTSASGAISLDAGFYVLRLELKKADGGRITKIEVIHIYHGLTTEASGEKYTFTDADFSYIFEVTFKDADGNHLYTETVANGALAADPGDAAVGVGEGLYLNFNPANFEGWADDNDDLYDFSAPVTDDITLTAKWSGTAPAPISLSGTGTIINQAVDYVNENASAGAYTLFIDNDYTTGGSTLTGIDANLTIIGLEQERTIQWSGTGGYAMLFGVGSVVNNANANLTLGNHITLKGVANTSTQIVQIRSGTLTMLAGSKITGHASTYVWGTVYVGAINTNNTATSIAKLIMNGGEITGNKNTSTASNNAVGGVYVSNFGEVIVNSGRITGNTANTGADEHPSDIFLTISGAVNYSNEGKLTLAGEAEIGAVKLNGHNTQYPAKNTFITLDGYTPVGVTVINLMRDIGSLQSMDGQVIPFWTDGTKAVLQAASGSLDPAILNYFTLGKFYGYETERRYINGNPTSVGNYQLKLDGDKAVLEKDETEVKGTTRANDFIVTGLVQGYDGAPKTVTITPKAGMSDGAITIFYDGSTNAPSAAGTYAVTFNVAEGTNYYAAAGFSAGTLTIAAPVTITTNADDGTGSLREAINSKIPSVIIAPGVGTIELEAPLIITGDVTIAITGNGATITRNASWTTTGGETQLMRVTGGATATISRVHFKDGRATDYGAAIRVEGANLTLESCIISGSRTTATGTYGGAMQAFQSTVALRGCTFYDNYSTAASSSGGVMYLRGTSNVVTLMGNLFFGNKASTSPLFYLNTSGNTVTSLGYNVIDVAFGTSTSSNNQQSGWAAEFGDTTFSELGVIGNPFDPFNFVPQAGLNDVIAYTLIGFPATDFNGAARTVPGSPGAVNSGNYVFEGYPVVAGDFTITGLTAPEDGTPKAVSIVPIAGKSTGAITIWYEGTGDTMYAKSITAPSAAGTYAVTFDVAAVTGAFLAATGLSAGTLAIVAPVTITINADRDTGSLRKAIEDKVPVIIIAPGVGTIELASRLVINSDITIIGNGVTLTRSASWTTTGGETQLMRVTDGATVTISRVHFKDGKATDYGAAIRVDGTSTLRVSLTLESCIISGSRTSTSSTWGGAMYATGANITFKGCTFYDNYSTASSSTGGAMYLGSTANVVTLMGNLFYGNTAPTSPLFNRPSSSTITSLGYNVIDVDFGTTSTQSGWDAVTGDTTFSALDVGGLPFSDVSFEPQAGLNGIIASTLAGFPATDFNGTTRTVPGASGAVNSGNFVFSGYMVVAGDFNITGLTVPADGTPQTVTIEPKANKSPGDKTIWYEGTGGTTYAKSTTAPSAAGTYAVTFDVAAAPGFLAATGLVAGTLAIIAPVALTDGTWVYTTLAVRTDEHWYTFSVTNGTTYYVWWDDENHGNTSGAGSTGDIVVAARYAGDTTWTLISGTSTDGSSDANAWTTARTIDANRTGTVQIRVIPYNRNSTPRYGIVYSTTSSRPALP